MSPRRGRPIGPTLRPSHLYEAARHGPRCRIYDLVANTTRRRHTGGMSELEVLGLSPEECTAYEFLVDSPPLTRAELEDGLTRLGEAGAGRSLAALEDRGLVTTWAGDPARFAAVAPDVALDNLARMREQDLVRAR